MKAAIAGTMFAVGAAACAHPNEPTRVPQFAFAAPVDSPASPCATMGEPEIAMHDPIATAARIPARTIARPGGSYLVVWIEGTIEAGYDVRGVVTSSKGRPIGAAFAISGMKHAALATLDAKFVDDARAKVSYYSSTELGFELVTATIVCAP